MAFPKNLAVFDISIPNFVQKVWHYFSVFCGLLTFNVSNPWSNYNGGSQKCFNINVLYDQALQKTTFYQS